MKRLLAACLALFLAVPAVAQVNPQNMPSNTVYGRLGIGSGPGQAIPLSVLVANLSGFGPLARATLCSNGGAFPIYNATAAAWQCTTGGGAGSFVFLNGSQLQSTGALLTLNASGVDLPPIQVASGPPPFIVPTLWVSGPTNNPTSGETNIWLDAFTTNGNGSIAFSKANGVPGALTATVNQNVMGTIVPVGWYSSAGTLARTTLTGEIQFRAEENFTSTGWGTSIGFYTTPIGSGSSPIEPARLRIYQGAVLNAATGGDKGAGTLNASSTIYVNGLAMERLVAISTAVNFNSTNTDTQIAIPLPTGVTSYQVLSVRIANASASISTATWGLFSATAGGGTAIFAAGQTVTVTSAAANTNNNSMIAVPTTAGTQSFNFANLFFRIGTAQGSAATADVMITIAPMY